MKQIVVVTGAHGEPLGLEFIRKYFRHFTASYVEVGASGENEATLYIKDHNVPLIITSESEDTICSLFKEYVDNLELEDNNKDFILDNDHVMRVDINELKDITTAIKDEQLLNEGKFVTAFIYIKTKMLINFDVFNYARTLNTLNVDSVLCVEIENK